MSGTHETRIPPCEKQALETLFNVGTETFILMHDRGRSCTNGRQPPTVLARFRA